MKKRRILTALTSLILLLAICTNLAACGTTVKAASLSDGITPRYVEALSDLTNGNKCAADFAVRLFTASALEGGNVLVSPLSVMSALAMTINGAEGNTLAQMESALGMKRNELNDYLYSYMLSLPEAEKYKLSLANSIWFTSDNGFNVSEEFLQTNADYYGADLYEAPFDKSTVKDINNWVKDKTDGMIPKILSDIPPFAAMYLVNALAFDAEWQKVYKKEQIKDATFTKEDGTEQDCDMMYSTEHSYIEDECATGFIKYYADSKYAFVALLPNQGISVSEYILSMSGEALYEMISNPIQATVNAGIPKFETEYTAEMSDTLAFLGITDAQDSSTADFSGIGSYYDENLYINSVIHKTYIQVDERGTRAGAATSIGLNGSSGPPSDIKTVYLDRPFVYMLVDCENAVPFFIGAMTDIEQ